MSSDRWVAAEHWAVTVERNGERLLTIESASLCGKPEFTPEEEQCIRDCGRHLLAFIGEPVPPGDDPATTQLLAALDVLYPLPDDDKRVERAGRTAFVLKRWMAARQIELEALVPRIFARFGVRGRGE